MRDLVSADMGFADTSQIKGRRNSALKADIAYV